MPFIWMSNKFLANKRQGTHSSKERGEVSGSTRKLKKTKRYRKLLVQVVLNRLFSAVEAVVFGPRPRKLRFQIEQKS